MDKYDKMAEELKDRHNGEWVYTIFTEREAKAFWRFQDENPSATVEEFWAVWAEDHKEEIEQEKKSERAKAQIRKAFTNDNFIKKNTIGKATSAVIMNVKARTYENEEGFQPSFGVRLYN